MWITITNSNREIILNDKSFFRRFLWLRFQLFHSWEYEKEGASKFVQVNDCDDEYLRDYSHQLTTTYVGIEG